MQSLADALMAERRRTHNDSNTVFSNGGFFVKSKTGKPIYVNPKRKKQGKKHKSGYVQIVTAAKNMSASVSEEDIFERSSEEGREFVKMPYKNDNLMDYSTKINKGLILNKLNNQASEFQRDLVNAIARWTEKNAISIELNIK